MQFHDSLVLCMCKVLWGFVRLKNVLWDYYIVFIGVWGILVSKSQVPSSIVFGDVMKYSGSFVYGQWTSCYTVSVIHHGKQWSRYTV